MMIALHSARSKLCRRRRSRCHGYAIAEFAPVFSILIIGFIIPLLDVGFIPIRYAVAYSVLTDVVHNLALSNKLSDAYNLIKTDTGWRTALSNCGIEIKHTELAVAVIDKNGDLTRFTSGQPGCIPVELLPNGKNGPGTYGLQLTVDIDVSPLLSVQGPGVPGLSSPVGLTILTQAPWENLGRDPDTTRFFVNE